MLIGPVLPPDELELLPEELLEDEEDPELLLEELLDELFEELPDEPLDELLLDEPPLLEELELPTSPEALYTSNSAI